MSDFVTQKEWSEWVAQQRERLRLIRRRSKPVIKEPATTPPPEPIDTTIQDMELVGAYNIFGLPEIEEPDAPDPIWVSKTKPGLDAGLSLDLDLNIGSEQFTTVLGPGFGLAMGAKEDSEKVERELGNSYGG